MILQALEQYYRRKAADPDSGIAPEGFEHKEIPFIIVIDKNGRFVDLQDTRERDEKGRPRPKSFLVPQGVKKTSGIASNLLWDNHEYVFGCTALTDEKDEKKRQKRLERIPEQHNAFIQRLEEDFKHNPPESLKPVLSFLYDTNEKEKIVTNPAWEQVKEAGGGNFTFKIDGDTVPVLEREDIRRYVEGLSAQNDDDHTGICLVTGKEEVIERLHPAIKGVWGAQTSGANIVSFNQDSFISFAKDQGLNAPVGKTASFAYTTALNTLLSRDSKQRIQIGDASTVFWAGEKNPLEDALADFFGEPPKDDPDRNERTVRAVFDAPKSGHSPILEDKTEFYILGLAPNAARISVRFWHVATVGNIAKNILQHFEDIKICHADFERPYLSIFRLLSSIAVQEKSDNIPPNLAGDTMKAILAGAPYPATLLQAALRRSRAAQKVTYQRAALIKACLNRANRYYNRDEKELQMSLDPENTNIGYNLGRMFAVLEKSQEEANPGLNATIRDRYYGAASSTPVAVFSTLLKLNKHHLAKIDNKGRAYNLEKIFTEIFSNISDFPSILKLEDQGRFAIGYYHQRQNFYTKKTEETNHQQKEAV